MSDDRLIEVDSVSKKYCRDLKRSLWYGVCDIARDLTGQFQQSGARMRRGEFCAVDEVSFELCRGETLALVGTNGAGKTTLLKLINGLIKPDSGQIRVRGRMGALIQLGAGFHPNLTGRENIFVNAAIIGMHRQEVEKQFDNIVDFASLGDAIDSPVRFYSSGMYARLGFSVAAFLNPEILIVDEVLAVGDAAFQQRCLGKMSDGASEGRTVIFVSHNMAAVSKLCSRAILMKDGAIDMMGETAEVVEKYLTNNIESLQEREFSDDDSEVGNDDFQLHRATVRPAENNADDPIYMDTPIVVEFEYSQLADEPEIDLTMVLNVADDTIAFPTSPLHNPDKPRNERGRYISRCMIPGNLLRDGQHWIRICVIANRSTTILDIPRLMQFNVLEDTSRRASWFGRRVGVVCPNLQWETTKI